MSRQRIMQCFLNADLRSGHDGLAALAKKNDMDVKTLAPGEYIVFINTGRDRIKVYASNNVIAYHRAEKAGSIDLRAVQMIPRVFNASGSMNYDQALKKAIEMSLENKKTKGLQVFQST